MKTDLAKVVEEFVKNSPAAWEHMCDYHQAQAAGRLGGFIFFTIVFLCLSRRIVPQAYVRCKTATHAAPQMGNGLLLALVVFAWLTLVIWGANEMPAAWGALFAPERDAAIDVLRIGR